VLAAAVLALTLTGASACGHADPDAAADPAASAQATHPTASGQADPAASAQAVDPATPCQEVMSARTTARDALAPLATRLSAGNLAPQDIANAADDLKAALTAMHARVAAAAERTGDPKLKDTIAAYQLSVEQAIVVVEGADHDPVELAAAITLPELHTAERAVLAACG
jgi:hypothetical protein